MTPADNKALVARLFEARLRGDPAPFADTMADDLVWRIIGSTAWSGTYVGKADIRERLIKPLYAQLTAPPRLTPRRILADGDYVVVECDGDSTTVRDMRYANTYCMVMRLADGKLREINEYMDTALVDRVLEPPGG